jgi:hypothetical protein
MLESAKGLPVSLPGEINIATRYASRPGSVSPARYLQYLQHVAHQPQPLDNESPSPRSATPHYRLGPLRNRSPTFRAHIPYIRESMVRSDTRPCPSHISIRLRHRPCAFEPTHLTALILPPSEPVRFTFSFHIHARRTYASFAPNRLLPLRLAPQGAFAVSSPEEGSRVPA